MNNYEAKENCTQKSISQMWFIPKQTVNTILKEFSANGYIELLTDKEDKRNKLVILTPEGNAYAGKIVEALHKRELFALSGVYAIVDGYFVRNTIGDAADKQFYKSNVTLCRAKH